MKMHNHILNKYSNLLRISVFFIGIIAGIKLSLHDEKVNEEINKEECSVRANYYLQVSTQGCLDFLKSPTSYNYSQAWQKLYAQNNYFRSESCIYSLIEANRFNNPEAFYMFAKFFHEMTVQTNSVNEETMEVERKYLNRGKEAALWSNDTTFVHLCLHVIKNGWNE
jgi:hypothetical protein